MKPLYKNASAQERIHALYDEKLKSLKIKYSSKYYETSFGTTHVIECGKVDGPPVVLLHGVNAGAPVAIEPIVGLLDQYKVYAIDSIGQTTRSATTRMSSKDDSFGRWLKEVTNQLPFEAAAFIGVSFGAMIVQKYLIYDPSAANKVIFVVPSGLVAGPKRRGVKELIWPLLKFKITKSDKHLRGFMKAFYDDADQHMYDLNRINLTEVNLDMDVPPILKEGMMDHIDQPVYCMVAHDDIFFPGSKAIERCRQLFKNFQGAYILKGSKHIPKSTRYPEINRVINGWLDS